VSGGLIQTWYEEYPEIFDESDLKNAVHQPIHHFLEWLSATLMFESSGWCSLIEKYGRFKQKGRKQEVIQALRESGQISARLHDMMQFPGRFGFPERQQCPDLLVYRADCSDWRFVETKWSGEKFHGQQQAFFKALSKSSGRPVEVARFREEK
jgi:hypothetical protein